MSKIECCLKESIHFRFKEKVIERVEVHIERGRGSGQKRCPLPVSCIAQISWDNGRMIICRLISRLFHWITVICVFVN